MSKKLSQKDIEKGIQNLLKVIARQNLEIKELKNKLAHYYSIEVAKAWEDMGATTKDATEVIRIFQDNLKVVKEKYGNGN